VNIEEDEIKNMNLTIGCALEQY